MGGTNIKQLETDFGNIGIVLDRFMPQTAVLAAELSVLASGRSSQVPEKGNFFYEHWPRPVHQRRGRSSASSVWIMVGIYARCDHWTERIR